MSLAIVADDLTGACDTGSLFARGGPVPLTLWPRMPSPIADVAVVDTESRGLRPAVAGARAADVARALAARRLFKKIDSTLRGPIGAETEALMAGAGLGTALVCPAFPAQARVVVDRRLLVGGVPVGETAVAGDPAFPRAAASPRAASTSSVVDLLRPQFTRTLGWLQLSAVRSGRETLAARIGRLGGMVIFADAETDADLDALVDAALAREPPPLLVGAAGLARALAARLGRLVGPVALPAARRWLVVAGSRHPASRRQADLARAAGLAVVTSPEAPEPDGAAVAARLAADARRRLEAEGFDLVAVTGGETAIALCRALGVDRLDLVGPPAPGLALAVARRSDAPDLWLLTKAGGFGAPDVFVSLAKAAA